MDYNKSLQEHNLLVNLNEDEKHKIINILGSTLNDLNISEKDNAEDIVIFAINYSIAHIDELSIKTLPERRGTVKLKIMDSRLMK